MGGAGPWPLPGPPPPQPPVVPLPWPGGRGPSRGGSLPWSTACSCWTWRGCWSAGVLLSNHVFAFLGLTGGTGTARLVHMAASHWGFLLMSFHLGLPLGRGAGPGTAVAGSAPALPRRARIRTLLGGSGGECTGLTVFFRRDFPTYLFLRSQFVFWTSPSPLGVLRGPPGPDGDLRLP